MQLLEAIVRLANKTALITGGNSGIGLATAKLFVAEGAKVVITGRNQATLDAAAKELGANALAVVADATNIAATEAAIKKGAEKFGKFDIVFANAGIAGGTPLGGATLEIFEKGISTNITAGFFTVQAALPHLKDGAVPGLRRCRACAGAGAVRRWRRDGLAKRCADLSLRRDRDRAFSVPIESEKGLYLYVLTRFLHANRYPLRLKTL